MARGALQAQADADDAFLDVVLAEPSLHFKSEKWFDLLQDPGVGMTPKEKEQFQDKNVSQPGGKFVIFGREGIILGGRLRSHGGKSKTSSINQRSALILKRSYST